MNFISICMCPVTVFLLVDITCDDKNEPHMTYKTYLEIRHCLCLLSSHTDEILNVNEVFYKHSPGIFQLQLLAYE